MVYDIVLPTLSNMWIYPLVNQQFAIEMAIEFVDLSIKNCDIP